jgi:hypothetical protein
MRAPATLLEQLIERQFQRDQDGRPIKDDALQAAYDGMRAAREYAEQSVHAATTIRSDATKTTTANEVRVQTTAKRLIESAAASLDRAHAKVRSELDKLGRETSPPLPTDQLQAQIAGEIRQHLRSLDGKTRDGILGAGEDSVIAAVAHAPGFLSGMTDTGRDLAVASWRRRKYPDACERETRLRKVSEAIERGGRSLPKFLDELTTPDAGTAAGLAHAADQVVQNARAE